MRISDWSSDVCSSDLLFGNLALERRNEALLEIDQVLRTQRCIDHPVEDFVAPGKLGRGQQLAIAHAAQRKIPFRHGLVDPTQVEQGYCPIQRRLGKRGGQFALSDRSRFGRNDKPTPHLFFGQPYTKTTFVLVAFELL